MLFSNPGTAFYFSQNLSNENKMIFHRNNFMTMHSLYDQPRITRIFTGVLVK